MANKIILWIAMAVMLLMSASALEVIPPDEVDSFLLDSLNNNYYTLLTIDYRGSEQNNALGSLVEYWDTALPSYNDEVDYINRAGGFAIEFLPIQNNWAEPGDLSIPDSFNLTFYAGATPHTYPCENFHSEKICPVFYSLTDVQVLNMTLGTTVYREKIFILSNSTPWSDNMNLSFHIYQFESPDALTFREKYQVNVTSNTLKVQDKVVGVVEKFGKTVDWSYMILLVFFWTFMIGLTVSVAMFALTVPFKFVDLLRSLKKKYAR